MAGRSKNSPRAGGGTRGRLLALLAATLTFIVPPRVGYWLCDRLAEVAFLVAGRYREAALANLAQVLGLPTGHPRVRAAARRAFRTSARNFWDLCSLPHRDPHLLAQWTVVTPGAWEVMLGALRRRRGLVIVTAHLGAFDYAGQLIALLPVRARILTARTTSGWLFETVTWLRASRGLAVEPVSTGALRRMVSYVRRGGVIGLLADRDIDRQGRPVTLFGRATTLPIGAVWIALTTGAPIVTMFCPREQDGYRLVVEELVLERTGDTDADLATNLDRLAALLERNIGAWPEQWVTFERVWPEAPSAARPPTANGS